ncbi:GNAT family N-acetyltransferase, partial [Lutimaribacter sp. EGI FJ00014]|nr:GNAT family N-acetyltransferase [Lutimaribacter sp. EGI FJ00014]
RTIPRDDGPRFEWRDMFTNKELNTLHSECFEHSLSADDWLRRVSNFSLGWVCTRASGSLVGFVNVAWDGGRHAFLLDTMIKPALRHEGYATSLVEEAVRHAKASSCD